MITEWRLATIRCIDKTRTRTGDTTRARHQVLNFLQPLLKPGVPKDVFKKLRQDVYQLCDDAYDLCLLMRHSKGTFVCPSLDPGTLPYPGSFGECHAVLNGGQPGPIHAWHLPCSVRR